MTADDFADFEDKVLVYLWELHERGERPGRNELLARIHRELGIGQAVATPWVDDFLELSEFSSKRIEQDAESNETVDLASFLHYETSGADAVRRGGLASVHRAFDTRFDRPVAIKVPLRRFLTEQEVCKRIMQEAKLCARLQHPNIVPIYEFGERGPIGCPFFVMKYVDGITLLEAIQSNRDKVAGRQRLLRVVREVVGALEHAHSRGIIHRDLKPENVMIGEFRETHLLDFGCAEEIGRLERDVTSRTRAIERFSQTVHGGVYGTYAYMSPEQAKGHLSLQSPKSDVFGIGGLLCHVLTGQPVYCGSLEQLVEQAKHCRTEGVRLRLKESGVPRALAELVMRCLERDPADRPTAAEVGVELDSYFDDLAQENTRNERRAKIAVAGLATLALGIVLSVAGAGLYRLYSYDNHHDSRVWDAAERWTLARIEELNSQREQLAERIHSIPLDEQVHASDSLLKLSAQLDEVTQLTQPMTAFPEVAARDRWIREQLAIDQARAESLLQRRIEDRRSIEVVNEMLQALRIATLEDDQLILNTVLGSFTRASRDAALVAREKILLKAGISLRDESSADWSRRLDTWTTQAREELAIHVESMACEAAGSSDRTVQVRLLELADQLAPHESRRKWRQLLACPVEEARSLLAAQSHDQSLTGTLPDRILAARIAVTLGAWDQAPALIKSLSPELFKLTEAEAVHAAMILLTTAAEAGTSREAMQLFSFLGGRGYDVRLPSAAVKCCEDNWAAATSVAEQLIENPNAPASQVSFAAWIFAKAGNEPKSIDVLARLSGTPSRASDIAIVVPEVSALLQLSRIEQAEVRLAVFRQKAIQDVPMNGSVSPSSLMMILEAEIDHATGREDRCLTRAEELCIALPTWSLPPVLKARALSAVGQSEQASAFVHQTCKSHLSSKRLLESAITSAVANDDWLAVRDYVSVTEQNGFLSNISAAAAISSLGQDSPIGLCRAVAIGADSDRQLQLVGTLALANDRLRDKDYVSSIKGYQTALALDAKCSEAWEGLAFARMLGDDAAATAFFEIIASSAEGLKVTAAETLDGFKHSELDSRRVAIAGLLFSPNADASAKLREHVKSHPSDITSRLILSSFLIMNEDIPEARQQLSVVVYNSPQIPNRWLDLFVDLLHLCEMHQDVYLAVKDKLTSGRASASALRHFASSSEVENSFAPTETNSR
jgi:serine/threonine protein kinase